MDANDSSSHNAQSTHDSPLSVWKQQPKLGIASFGVSILATIASVRALMYINFGVKTPTDALLSTISTYISMIFPIISILLGWWGLTQKSKSKLSITLGIGISLFILSTVGFAYLLSALF